MKVYAIVDPSTNIVTTISDQYISSSIEFEVNSIEDIKHKEGYYFIVKDNLLIQEIIPTGYIALLTKKEKIEQVANIKVEVSTGNIFDGDEISQDRMVRAINIASITNQTSTQWKLANNTIVEVTLDELKEALSLAGQEMSRIWLS